jgi:hypothetical protein
MSSRLEAYVRGPGRHPDCCCSLLSTPVTSPKYNALAGSESSTSMDGNVVRGVIISN